MFRVKGLGFGLKGSELMFRGLGFRLEVLRFRCRVNCLCLGLKLRKWCVGSTA